MYSRGWKIGKHKYSSILAGTKAVLQCTSILGGNILQTTDNKIFNTCQMSMCGAMLHGHSMSFQCVLFYRDFELA